MKQKLTVFNFMPSEKDVIKVKLPFGTGGESLEFAQGDQLIAETLVAGTEDVYTGELVVGVDADKKETAIIFNQGVYADEFGNRHGYVVNPSYIRYKSGEIITMVRPSKNIKLQVSADAITGTVETGKYLVPQLATAGTPDTYGLKVVASNSGYATAYKIEKADAKIEIGTAKYVTAPILRTV